MWILYIIFAVLTAGVMIKILRTLKPEDKYLSYALTVIIPVLAVTIYTFLGSPEQSGSPVIFNDLIERDQRQMALLAQKPMEIILNKDPENYSALGNLGAISMQLKKYDLAESFYKRALKTVPKDTDTYIFLLLDLGEAQVAAKNGVVTPEAVKTFQKLKQLNPMGSLATHYLAMADAQNGRHEKALEAWTLLLRDVPGNAIFWKKRVREEMAKSRAALEAQKKN
jgi:cytochrome c-type biogenesis protein CcmH